jgi:hypothetical protein
VQHSTFEAIKDNHQRRMDKLEEMIEERRLMVEEHENGRRRLSDDEYDRAARQHTNFQRKLNQMRNRNDDVSRMERGIMFMNPADRSPHKRCFTWSQRITTVKGWKS